MKRKPKPNGQHLTREQRDIIQVGIQNRSNKVDIARTLGKDATTIAKEIRTHRIQNHATPLTTAACASI